MSQTTQDHQQKGEYRCLTAAEIGGYVAYVRKEVLGWKQLALAAEAGVTERTVQRVERGEKVGDDTLQKVALALRLPENAFLGPRHIPAAQEAAEKAVQALAEIFEEKKIVDVQPVTQAKDVDQILGAQVWLIDDGAVTEPACEQAACLKELVRDWGDLYSGLSPIERRKACLDVFATIQEIEGRGYAARCARYTMDSDGFEVAVLVLVPKSDWHGCGLKQMLVPRSLKRCKLDF